MGIKHSGVIDVIPFPSQRRFNGQGLDVDIRLHQRRQVGREAADVGRLDAVFVNETGYLNAAAFRKIIDEAPRWAHCRKQCAAFRFPYCG